MRVDNQTNAPNRAKQAYHPANFGARCPHCGAALVPGRTFCAVCGYKLQAKKSNKETYIIIAAIAFAVVLVGVALFLTLPRLGAKPQQKVLRKPSREEILATEPSETEATAQTQAPTEQPTEETTVATQAPEPEPTEEDPEPTEEDPETEAPDNEATGVLSQPASKLTAERVYSIYKAFFYENFSVSDLVCMADVTHDGIDDLIVVHPEKEGNMQTEGYVFTVNEDKQVCMIYSKICGTSGMGNQFSWYIRKSDEGYNLASEEGFWSTGMGTLMFHEYYLTQEGEVCDVVSVSIESGDYKATEELDKAFEQYDADVRAMKEKLYTLYFYLTDGYDKNTIAMFPMESSEVFSDKAAEELDGKQLRNWKVYTRGDVAAVYAYADQIAVEEDITDIYMYDMDGDNVRELILKTGIAESGAEYKFYSYRDGSLHQLGNISAGHSSLCIQDGQLIMHYGQMGYEQVYELTMQQGSVVSTLTLDRTLGEGEKYMEFSQQPVNVEGADLSVLANTYLASEMRLADMSYYYRQENDSLTNGVLGYHLLPDGTILRVDAVTGDVGKCFRLQNPQNVTPLFATDNRLYFVYDDPDDWWGIQVYSYNIAGEDYQDLGTGWDAEAQEGYLLLESYRSDVSPKLVTVIDCRDRVLVSDAHAWDAAIYDGAVYYLAINPDECHNESYETYTIRELCVVDTVRGRDCSSHTIAEYEVKRYASALIMDGTVHIWDASWDDVVDYDLVTGAKK